jgi:hypothetical protein
LSSSSISFSFGFEGELAVLDLAGELALLDLAGELALLDLAESFFMFGFIIYAGTLGCFNFYKLIINLKLNHMNEIKYAVRVTVGGAWGQSKIPTDRPR